MTDGLMKKIEAIEAAHKAATRAHLRAVRDHELETLRMQFKAQDMLRRMLSESLQRAAAKPIRIEP